MLKPMERPPASRAPRLAASMIPDPRPVTTVNASRARPAPISRASVVGMILLETGGGEHGHARSHEAQGTGAAHELDEDGDGAPELGPARTRPFEEAPDLGRGGGLLP